MVASLTERETPEFKQFTRTLEQGGIDLVHRTVAPEQLGQLVRSMQNEVGCVVLTTGHGKFAAGAIALRDTGLPLGILPVGAGDHLSTRLGIPPDPAAAAGLILAGHRWSLNLAMVNGHPFLSVASIGLTVEDARALGRATRHPMKRLAFAWQAARLVLRAGRFAAIIRCGSIVHRVYTVQITIGNGHAYIGNMEPGTEQPREAGILDVYSLEPATKWGLLFLLKAFNGRDGTIVPEARRAHAPVVEIVTRLPRPILADGAVIAITPARFTILTRAVDVFGPAPPRSWPVA